MKLSIVSNKRPILFYFRILIDFEYSPKAVIDDETRQKRLRRLSKTEFSSVLP
jgi:hypothetical protein